jgi:signal transduction histidine kinase
MASLLKRQLKKYLPEDLSGNLELKSFLEAVERSYANYEEKLSMMQRATTISSEELSVAYRELMIEAERQKQVETSLKRAVDSLNVNLGVTDKLEHNENLNIGAEKLARHVTMLASQITTVTEEKNALLKDLEAQNDALNNYVQMVSHDLKSPIRNINALMSWILEEEKSNFSAVSKQNCSLVSENLLRMDNLINGILKHATVGDHMETRTNLDMHKLVLEVANSSSMPSNIMLKIDEGLPVISIQKYWIEQVFSNLISNAITATEHRKDGIIAVDFIADEAYWKFSVSDNGKGIPQKHLVSIFDMFRKLENGTNAAGVGLSLVKKITGLFQGDVWLESQVDIGTTFYITFKKEYDG